MSNDPKFRLVGRFSEDPRELSRQTSEAERNSEAAFRQVKARLDSLEQQVADLKATVEALP